MFCCLLTDALIISLLLSIISNIERFSSPLFGVEGPGCTSDFLLFLFQVDVLLRQNTNPVSLPSLSAIVVLNDTVLWTGNFGKRNGSDPHSGPPNEYTIYRWEYQQNLQVLMLELCDKVECEYGNQLTQQALTAVLLSGFEKPLARLEAAASRINSNHVMVPMKFDQGEFPSNTGRTTTYREPSEPIWDTSKVSSKHLQEKLAVLNILKSEPHATWQHIYDHVVTFSNLHPLPGNCEWVVWEQETPATGPYKLVFSSVLEVYRDKARAGSRGCCPKERPVPRQHRYSIRDVGVLRSTLKCLTD